MLYICRFKIIQMKSIFFLVFMGLSAFTFAQQDTTVIVNLPHKQYDKKHKKPSDEANTIKIAPLGFVSGAFPVYYERVINDFFSVQGGIGITSRNYVRNAFQSIGDNFLSPVYPWSSNSTYDLADPALEIGDRKANLGFLFSLQPRIYFTSDAPDESYMGISYDFYRYNFSIPGMVYNTATSEYNHAGSTKKEHENISDLMVWFGYQDVYDRISIEYSTGIGIRNVKGVKYYFAEDNSSGTPTTLEGYAPYKQTLFNFNIGIRVGYHF